MDWLTHVNKWKDCQRCPLAQQRELICLARGTLPAQVVFIGEAPGTIEDSMGQPFVGPAGRMLDQIIERCIPQGVTYALTNLVACFPREAKMRGDNEPETSEILECRPRLHEFINIAQPILLVCVGGLATRFVNQNDTIPCVNVLHPSYILKRMPNAQQGMAARKITIQISQALAKALEKKKPFAPFGVEDAKDSGCDKIPF